MWVLLLIIFNLALYWRTLSYGLVIDDIEQYQLIKRSPFKLSMFRGNNPVTMLTRFIYGAYGFNPAVEHAITLSLHIITGILILTAYNPYAAFIYCAHPINHQTAIWLNGRRYAILNILILTLVITHTVYLVALIIPPIIIHFINRNRPRRALYRIVRPPLTHLMVVFKSLGFNIYKLTATPRIASLYPFLENDSLEQLAKPDRFAIVGIVTILCLLPTHPFILLLLLLASSTIPYTQTCGDRYLSLPTVFLCGIIGHLSPWCLVMTIPFSIRSLQLQPLYHNIQSFYDYHANLYPNLKKLPLLKRLYPSIK